ncbi:hypothetical protein ACTML9_09800 [Porphyromonas levii]|uniref:hypothetical protein n=1 Tax=Porphyromonas levii TaxID=28114 RepID=UPI003FA01F20
MELNVYNLGTMLQNRQQTESKRQLAEIGGGGEDNLPQQKNATAIDSEKRY